jgi:hypothetical protein
MADLSLSTTGTPATKQWLNIKAGSVAASFVTAGPDLTPVTVGQYTQTENQVIANTDFGSLTDGATHVGTLTIPLVSPGTVVKIKVTGAAVAAAASVNYALYVDGKQATSPTSFGAFTGTNGVQLDSTICIQAGNTSAFLNAQMSGSSPNSNNQISITWDQTLTHQIDIFAIISATSINNGFTCTSFFVELSNGA